MRSFYTLKTKFFNKKLVRYAAINKEKSHGAACRASHVQGFKTKTAWGGRGAGTPAPQLRLRPQNFGAGKILPVLKRCSGEARHSAVQGCF
jgi:hypothetical protein